MAAYFKSASVADNLFALRFSMLACIATSSSAPTLLATTVSSLVTFPPSLVSSSSLAVGDEGLPMTVAS